MYPYTVCSIFFFLDNYYVIFIFLKPLMSSIYTLFSSDYWFTILIKILKYLEQFLICIMVTYSPTNFHVFIVSVLLMWRHYAQIKVRSTSPQVKKIPTSSPMLTKYQFSVLFILLETFDKFITPCSLMWFITCLKGLLIFFIHLYAWLFFLSSQNFPQFFDIGVSQSLMFSFFCLGLNFRNLILCFSKYLVFVCQFSNLILLDIPSRYSYIFSTVNFISVFECLIQYQYFKIKILILSTNQIFPTWLTWWEFHILRF